jgi:hypothetical protein
MSIKSAVVIAAALVTLGMGSVAFADPVILDYYGTGNNEPVYYDSQGGLHWGTPGHAQVGTKALAMAPKAQANEAGVPTGDNSCFVSPASQNFTSCDGD